MYPRERLRHWMASTPCPCCGRPWTAKSVAKIVGVSKAAIDKWLCGLRTPEARHRQAIEAMTRKWGDPANVVTAEEWAT